LLVVALAVLSWVIWSDVARLPDGRLHLTLLDVNTPNQSGESVLIKTPGGRFVLINGGPSVNRLSQALGRRLPLSHRHLDWLVIGGVEDGQLAALPTVIQRYSPGHVLWAGGTLASPAASLLHTALLQSALDRQPAAAGQVLELEEGLVLRVLAVGPRGAVLLLEYENFRAMLPVGPDAGMLAQLDPASIGRVTAWLLAGSGYAPLNPPQWVEHLRPEVILLSVAPADARGLPSPDTLASLQGYNLLRTDVNGWIELVTDGEQMWVQVEKIRQPGQ
jgi:beta-lactamase superfamily II metal-dependent hydrolase